MKEAYLQQEKFQENTDKVREINALKNTVKAENKEMKNSISESLKETITAYIERNITLNGKEITFDNKFKQYTLEQNPEQADQFILSFDHSFLWMGIQETAPVVISMPFKVVMENNNYYLQFDPSKNTYTQEVRTQTTDRWTTIVYGNVIYTLNTPNEKQKTTDIRMGIDIEKTKERIKNKIAETPFNSLVNVKEKVEFEKTQITGLNKVKLSKEVVEEKEGGYSRSLYLYDEDKAIYRPITKIYFDKIGNLDINKTAKAKEDKNKQDPFKVLGQSLAISISKNKENWALQFKFNEVDIQKLENKVALHRAKLINYIDQAKVAPGSKFDEFNKENKERPRHKGENKFLFDTAKLELNIMNDTYLLNAGRDDKKMIHFGFSPDEKNNIYIKDLKGDKIEAQVTKNGNNIINVDKALDIAMDKNNVYNIFDYQGQLTMFKAKEGKETKINTYPVLNGAWAALLPEGTLREYGNKAMNYYDQENGQKLTSLPSSRNKSGEWQLENVSTQVNTRDLINMEDFDPNICKSLNITEEDIKIGHSFLFETQSNIELMARKTVKIFNPETKKYEYYIPSQKDIGGPITLTKDKELYDTAAKITENMKNRLDTLNKIEQVELRWKNKGNTERFEGAIGGGRWLEKSSIDTFSKITFIQGTNNLIPQKIFRGKGESTTIEYKIKGKNNIEVNLLDPKAVKLEGTWLLNRKIKPTIDIQQYKVKLENKGNLKLNFDPVE